MLLRKTHSNLWDSGEKDVEGSFRAFNLRQLAGGEVTYATTKCGKLQCSTSNIAMGCCVE